VSRFASYWQDARRLPTARWHVKQAIEEDLSMQQHRSKSWLALGALACAATLAGCAQPGYNGYGNYNNAPPNTGYQDPNQSTYQAPAGSVFTGRGVCVSPY
jgi:hypothetical protein